MSHVPIEISNLCYHFLNNNEQNTLTTIVTGKRNQEVGLAVSANLFFQKKKKKKDRKSAQTLEIELAKRKSLFPIVNLKYRKKGIYRKFLFYVAKH